MRTKMARLKHWNIVIGFVMCLAGISEQTDDDLACPRECDCFKRNSPTLVVDVFCSLRVIDRISNFSSLQSKHNITLTIKCTSVLHSELYNNMFKDLSLLQRVVFDGCLFSYVPHNMFSGMTSLEEIVIKNAREIDFHPNVFEDIPSLTRITVMGSGLTKMPSLCKLPKLMELNLTHNAITDIAYVGLHCFNETLLSLSKIVLNFNLLTVVEPNLGQTVPNLWEYGLGDNLIETIHPEAFHDLINLGWLDLSNNTIDRLPPYMLREQSFLKLIALGDNPVQSIPSGFFGFSSKLLVVALGAMGVDDSIWQQLSSLKDMTELQLQNNHITRIDRDILSNFKNLKYLDFHGNRLTDLRENMFMNLSYLETLNLGSNRISDVDKNTFRGLGQLRELDLRRNNITSIHNESLLPLQSLQQMNLSYNGFDEIPALGTMVNLIIADLRFNRINSITPETFEGLNALQGLCLMGNKLRQIPREVFDKPKNLQILQLSKNDIDTIEENAFQRASNLGWLFLSDNKLTDISSTFINLRSLRHLDLSRNRIQGAIYDSLFPNSVKFLDLSVNEITSVHHYAFYKFKELRKVDIRFNRITSLEPLAITVSPTLQGTPPAFYISGNMYKCECKLRWLRKRINQKRPSFGQPVIRDIDMIMCASGYHARNKFLYILDVDEMLCSYKEECMYSVCQCCDFYGCVCRYDCPDSCSCFRSSDHHKVNFIVCSERNVTAIPTHMPSVATKVWMDGNRIQQLAKHDFLGMNNIHILYLNQSKIQFLENGSFVGLTKIHTLLLNNNLIQELLYGMFFGLTNVREINLEHNHISFIDDNLFEHTPNLQRLSLAHNQLQFIPETVFMSNGMWHALTLSGNPWSCDCYFLSLLLQNTYLIADNVTDRASMQCYLENRNRSNPAERGTYFNLLDINMEKFCRNTSNLYINFTTRTRTSIQSIPEQQHQTTLIAIVIGVSFFVVLIALIFWQRRFLHLVMYSKCGCRFSPGISDDNKDYDAFISYSHKDEDFVLRQLVPKLEDVKRRYKLCVHYRDFPMGTPVADAIARSIQSSKRTILIVSDNFLESEWCQYEFQTAHHNVLIDKSNRLIVILLQDLKRGSMDADLKLYLKTRTCLKYEDPWFWEKLFFAMPEVRIRPSVIRNANAHARMLRSVSAIVQDDEGYETPVSRLSSVHRHTSDSGFEKVSLDSMDEPPCHHIYEEIHPVLPQDQWFNEDTDPRDHWHNGNRNSQDYWRSGNRNSRHHWQNVNGDPQEQWYSTSGDSRDQWYNATRHLREHRHSGSRDSRDQWHRSHRERSGSDLASIDSLQKVQFA